MNHAKISRFTIISFLDWVATSRVGGGGNPPPDCDWSLEVVSESESWLSIIFNRIRLVECTSRTWTRKNSSGSKLQLAQFRGTLSFIDLTLKILVLFLKMPMFKLSFNLYLHVIKYTAFTQLHQNWWKSVYVISACDCPILYFAMSFIFAQIML